jgi:glycosyltransferase involved in cell wall biosynthesis
LHVKPPSFVTRATISTKEKGQPRAMPPISVIVPTFNNGPFILESIQSIFEQTLPADEIIIVDDGSTDDTRQVIQQIDDSRVQYVAQANAGVSAARNRGLELASGAYVTFLDADDRWRPTMLEKQAAVLDHDESLVCSFTNFVRFQHPDGAVLPDQFTFYPEIPTLPVKAGPLPGTYVILGDAFSALVGFGEIPAYTQVSMYRRRAMEGLTFDPSLKLEDMPFFLRVAMRGSVAFNTEVLAEVRRHGQNLTLHYSRLSPAKVPALLAVGPHVDSEPRRRAYHDRLVKAYIDTAVAKSGQREIGAGLSAFQEALRVPGSYLRKAKGGIRLAQALARSALRRDSHPTA